MIEVIGLDADDTLWHNEVLYKETKTKFVKLLSRYRSVMDIEDQLDRIEIDNLQYYGYGIKSFALSMVETAVRITDGNLDSSDILRVIDFTKEMLAAEVGLIKHVQETLNRLSQKYNLMLITKGDTFEQERKVNRSGLEAHFAYIEVVSVKTQQTYLKLLDKYNIHPTNFLMVGNSLRSDILPVLAIGGQAVYIPYQDTWEHENDIEESINKEAYFEIPDIDHLPELLSRIDKDIDFG